jgi:hypothetical protein
VCLSANNRSKELCRIGHDEFHGLNICVYSWDIASLYPVYELATSFCFGSGSNP